MALISCDECGHMISDKAQFCPKCGKQLNVVQQPQYYTGVQPTRDNNVYNWLYVLIGALAVIAIIALLLLVKTCGTEKPPTPATTAVEQSVTPASPAVTHHSEPSLRSGVIVDPVDDYVNVRSGKGTNHSVLQRLDVGTTVLYEPGHKWVKVYDTNHTYLGYVYHDRIR